MKLDANENKGMSLVSFVVSIIVVAIIIWTVIKVLLGSGSVLYKAQQASRETKNSGLKEKIELVISSYEAVSYESKKTFGEYLKTEKSVDNFWEFENYIIMKVSDAYFLVRNNNSWNVIGNINFKNDDAVEKSITSYTSAIAAKRKNAALESEGIYILDKNVPSDYYKFVIPKYGNVTLVFTDEYKIDNKNKERAAIDLGEGSTLNLEMYSYAEVSSKYNGKEKIVENNVSDKAGYAGIHVPVDATLNVYGKGSLTVYGGSAGKGGTFSAENVELGNGGGGAGAGIGGNGGEGGKATKYTSIQGGVGGTCGTVNIYDNVKLTAIGGAGGEGGDSTKTGAGAGGGYPAAGIGGGGAGGAGATEKVGGGGYSGGAGICVTSETLAGGIDGNAGSYEDSNINEKFYAGGGYFKGAVGTDKKEKNRENLCLGGFGSVSESKEYASNNGGVSGAGGNVFLYDDVKVIAKNGNKFTKSSSGDEPVNIFVQNGKNAERYEYKTVEGIKFTLNRVMKSKKVATSGWGQGIGAGAGFIESGNGKVTDWSKD